MNLSSDDRMQALQEREEEIKTLKKRLEALAVENAKLKGEKAKAGGGSQTSWNSFLVKANHDLRQPLNALSLFASSLEAKLDHEKVPNLQAYKDIISKIQKSQKSMEDYLVTLSDMAKFDAGLVEANIEAVSLSEILAEVQGRYRPLADEKRIGLVFQGDTAVRVKTDKIYLSRLLGHLVSNGIKFTEKGTVTVECQKNGETLSVGVLDSGRGIPANEIERVFEPFHKLHNEQGAVVAGLGLGLSLVRRVSELLATPLTVQSAPGEGTKIAIQVPALEQVTDGEGLAETPTEPLLQSQRPAIIVLDDDTSVLDSLVILLETWGYSVVAGETLEDISRSLEDDQYEVGLIIADYHLSNSMSGPRAVSILREKFKEDAPAVIVTGELDIQLQEETKSNKCLLMQKPLQPASLRQVIRNAIAGKIKP